MELILSSSYATATCRPVANSNGRLATAPSSGASLCRCHLIFSLPVVVPKGGGVLYGHVVVFSASPSSSVVVPGDDAGGRVVELDFVDGGEWPNCVLHFTFCVLCVNFDGFVVLLCYLVVLFVKCKCSIYGIYMRIHGIFHSRVVDSIQIDQPLP
jgi:hypothetical protein